jgi:hypothetical protein
MSNRTNRRRSPRQLELGEKQQRTPIWTTLPERIRLEVVELIARLLRNAAAAASEEDGDE